MLGSDWPAWDRRWVTERGPPGPGMATARQDGKKQTASFLVRFTSSLHIPGFPDSSLFLSCHLWVTAVTSCCSLELTLHVTPGFDLLCCSLSPRSMSPAYTDGSPSGTGRGRKGSVSQRVTGTPKNRSRWGHAGHLVLGHHGCTS